MEAIAFDKIISEVEVTTSRSGGPGGQHANKTETRVQLAFNIPGSAFLSDKQKERLLKNLESKISTEGDLLIQSSETRSQSTNKEIAFKKLKEILEKGLKKKKKRKKTKPPKSADEKRLKAKKARSEKKKLREPPRL